MLVLEPANLSPHLLWNLSLNPNLTILNRKPNKSPRPPNPQPSTLKENCTKPRKPYSGLLRNEISQAVPEIDLLLGGHDHFYKRAERCKLSLAAF